MKSTLATGSKRIGCERALMLDSRCEYYTSNKFIGSKDGVIVSWCVYLYE